MRIRTPPNPGTLLVIIINNVQDNSHFSGREHKPKPKNEWRGNKNKYIVLM